jgi:hypothetical protein
MSNTKLHDQVLSKWQKLQRPEIEKIFRQTSLDLRKILVLDRVEFSPNGFRIRCHDRNGPVPEIAIAHSGDTFQDKDRLGHQICKAVAITRLRDRTGR